METPDDPQIQHRNPPIRTVIYDNLQPESPKEDAQSVADAPQQPRVDDAGEGENGENTTTVDWVDPTQQGKKKKKRSKKSKSKRGKVLLSLAHYVWLSC